MTCLHGALQQKRILVNLFIGTFFLTHLLTDKIVAEIYNVLNDLFWQTWND